MPSAETNINVRKVRKGSKTRTLFSIIVKYQSYTASWRQQCTMKTGVTSQIKKYTNLTVLKRV